jgi:ATP-binding cassette, subfamily B (MDR/TAP), member 1
VSIQVQSPPEKVVPAPSEKPVGVLSVTRAIYPSIPNKPLLLFIGIFICLLSGAMTLLFSFMLSRLLYEVSSGAHVVHTIIQHALITPGIAAGLKSIVMEAVDVRWMTHLRKIAFKRIVSQEKASFDNPERAGCPENHPARLVGAVIKDTDDAKRLISICLCMCVVVIAMLSLGLIWALVWRWQLTLVGVGIVLVFAGAMALQARISSVWALKSKRACEEVSKVCVCP